MAIAVMHGCRTQWRHEGFSGGCWLDFPGCVALIERLLPRWKERQDEAEGSYDVADALEDLQLIEAATIEARDEVRAERAKEKP